MSRFPEPRRLQTPPRRSRSRYLGDWVSTFAGLIIVLLPTVVVFLVLQRRIMGGMTIGALKG